MTTFNAREAYAALVAPFASGEPEPPMPSDEALMEAARDFASDGGRWPSDWLAAMHAAIRLDRKGRKT